MLFQKEKDYGNTITKIGRKKNKKNETAKKKRKIKKERKCSLKNRILASSMVRRISNLFLNTSSEKVSFCALNKKARAATRCFSFSYFMCYFSKNISGLHPNAPSIIRLVKLTFARDVFKSLILCNELFPYKSLLVIQTWSRLYSPETRSG